MSILIKFKKYTLKILQFSNCVTSEFIWQIYFQNIDTSLVQILSKYMIVHDTRAPWHSRKKADDDDSELWVTSHTGVTTKYQLLLRKLEYPQLLELDDQ